jgi:hypothetical protein
MPISKTDRRGDSKRRRRLPFWLWSPLPYLFFGVLSSIYIHVVLHYSLSSFDNNNNNNNNNDVHPVEPRHYEQMESKPCNEIEETPETPELSACLIVMDDNHFLIGECIESLIIIVSDWIYIL